MCRLRSVSAKRIKKRNIGIVAKRTGCSHVESPAAGFATRSSALTNPAFFLFSFARYATINSDWRTRGALRSSRFKKSRNVRAYSPSTRKSQSEFAIYGEGYHRTSPNLLSKCTQIRSSSSKSNRAICSSIWRHSRASSSLPLLFTGNNNSKWTIFLWTTNYVPNYWRFFERFRDQESANSHADMLANT